MIDHKLKTWRYAFHEINHIKTILFESSKRVSLEYKEVIKDLKIASDIISELRLEAKDIPALRALLIYHGVEMEVRLKGMSLIPPRNLTVAIAAEINRCNQLLYAIARHLD